MFIERFKKHFSKMLNKNYDPESTPKHYTNDEQVDELKERITNLEIMFSEVMQSVNKIKNDVGVIKDAAVKRHN
jgi:hypothetical protein